MPTPARFLPRQLPPVRIDRAEETDEAAETTDALEIVRHVFDGKSIAAVNGALAAGRPLLVRGEPGVGKTQLAAAVAAALHRPLVAYTVNARTESTDLLWRFDAVRRLAEAQLCAAGGFDEARARRRLAEWRFVEPGPLWWGFDWTGAEQHLKNQCDEDGPTSDDSEIDQLRSNVVRDRRGDPGAGVVVLIDEIDKADTDVPNGLLEALGAGGFTPQGCTRVESGNTAPLVIITTNEERVLPDPFIRRCLVLHIRPPTKAEYIARGEAHFGTGHQTLLEAAVTQLLADRERSTPPQPGLAEYLDLVRAVIELAREQGRKADELIAELGEFTLRKQSGGEK